MKFRIIMSLIVVAITGIAFLVMNTDTPPKPTQAVKSQPNAFKR